MKNKKIKFLFVFVIFNLMSPWFWVGVKNKVLFQIKKTDFYQLKSQPRLYEVNTLQGEASRAGVGLLGRLAVNKYSWPGKDFLTRATEGFDFHFLFIEGDLNLKKSTRTAGPILLFFSPMIVYGFVCLSSKQRILLLISLLCLSSLGAFMEPHFETTSRLPLILALNSLAAWGLVLFFSSPAKKGVKTLYSLLLVWEFFRFVHDFYLHYPGRSF